MTQPELCAIQESHLESRLDRLGRLFPFALGVLDTRCDDIASSVLCTASAYLHLDLSINERMSHPERARTRVYNVRARLRALHSAIVFGRAHSIGT